jgi:MFS family permease
MTKTSWWIALRSRNFRLLWLGQLISTSGSMMQTAAILWHVSLLAPPGRKGLALGTVGLVRVLPILLFAMIGGVVADARDRRRLMLVTQGLMASTAITLALLTFQGLRTVWPLYLLTAIGAAAGVFDTPARQSLIPSLVPREHLPNAISLNTIMFQAAAVLGPSLAGIVIAAAGVGTVYALNAISFAAVIAALLAMREVPVVGQAERGQVSLAAALEGLRFVFSTPLIRSTMLLDFFATFFSSAVALLPIFAQDILHVGARGYGWLYAAPSIGALLTSAVMVRWTDRIERRGPVLLASVGLYGLATVVFGWSRTFWLTLLCLALTGAADTVSMVLRNVIRQLATPDHLRGRMVGVNMVFFMGGPQLGELEAGLVAQLWGAPLSVISGGLGCLIATGWTALQSPALRRYRRDDHLRAPAVLGSRERRVFS